MIKKILSTEWPRSFLRFPFFPISLGFFSSVRTMTKTNIIFLILFRFSLFFFFFFQIVTFSQFCWFDGKEVSPIWNKKNFFAYVLELLFDLGEPLEFQGTIFLFTRNCFWFCIYCSLALLNSTHCHYSKCFTFITELCIFCTLSRLT